MASPKVKAKRQRRARRTKLRKLRRRLAETKTTSERRRLAEKIRKISPRAPIAES